MDITELNLLHVLNNTDNLTDELKLKRKELKAVINRCSDPTLKMVMRLRFDSPKGDDRLTWFQIGMIVGTNGDALRMAVKKYLAGI